MEQPLYDRLKQLREHIPRLTELLKLGADEDMRRWTDIVDARLLTRLDPEFPLVAAICGGGSSGKSTLFNTLVGERFAPTGGTAGLNRRVLFSIPADRAGQPGLIAALADPFKAMPEALTDPTALSVPGGPFYVLNQSAAGNLVLLDTPDFDTGAKGAYINREVTRMALEASDILIYIFTNSNYNNRDNTDFIGQMLTGIGKRKCFLVYRVYPSYTHQEVLEHARTVAGNIYGDLAEHYLLGVYRADEDNRVASGLRFMELSSVPPRDGSLLEALQAIDAPELRRELYASVLADVLQRAGAIRDRAQVSIDELGLYLDALKMAQSVCAHEALKHFPMDQVMRRFARIWEATDPSHVKWMRKTGSVIELPLRVLLGAAGWAKDQLSPDRAQASSAHEFEEKLDEDLVTAVTKMYYQAVSPQLSTAGALSDPVAKRMLAAADTIRAQKGLKKEQNPQAQPSGEGAVITFLVDAHPVVVPEQEKLRRGDFKSVLHAVFAEKDDIVGISPNMEIDLEELADQFRGRMGLWRKISQTFWAFLNVLPATVAVTYVLSTGDPVGAAGIKIKLTGLFGVKDLYALFAIPVTTGLKKADRMQIEEMLGPIVQTWLNHKLITVQRLIEANITGGIIREARTHIAAADELLAEINALMATSAP